MIHELNNSTALILGPARAVCKDWLSDARGVLEASQTLFALMTHANAQNQRSF